MHDKKFYWSVVNANGWGGINSQPEYTVPGYSGRDIFVGPPDNNYSNNPPGIAKYADGGDLGLTHGDDIDGISTSSGKIIDRGQKIKDVQLQEDDPAEMLDPPRPQLKEV